MKNVRICSIVLLALLLSATPAHALWFRSSSVEWKTDLAEIVVIGSVQATKSIEPLNEYWDSQEVMCQFVEAVKGEWSKPVSFRQDFENARHPEGSTRRLKKGERVLLFLWVDSKQPTPEVANWINLSHPVKEVGPSRTPSPQVGPSRPTSPQAAYNNASKLLADETSILKVVSDHACELRRPKRGIIVSLGLNHWFVITAEPEFKQQFVDQLQSKSYHTRCYAIFNLVSYPGDATRRLIRPFLGDSATATVRNYNGEGRDITYYPVRQTAYVALALLDDNPPLPKPYFDKAMSFMFNVGFDVEVYFPKGNWKRLKDIVDPPSEFPFNFLKGQKPVAESHNWRHLDYLYAFQADFAKTRKSVEKELLSNGFKIADDSPRGLGRKWISVEYERGRDMVVIHQHMRYTKRRTVYIDGWVSFQVQLERTTGSVPAANSNLKP